MKKKQDVTKTDSIDFLYILGLLWRYKWFIIGITSFAAIFILVLMIISMSLPPEANLYPDIYRPGALILVNEKVTSELLGNRDAIAFGLPITSSYGALAVILLKSKTILDNIIEEFNVAERYKIKSMSQVGARRKILEHLIVNYDDNTLTISIYYEDYDPKYATDIVNRFVELLDKRFLELGGNIQFTQKNLVEKKLSEVIAEITELEAQIQEFQQKYGVLDIDNLAVEQVTMVARFRSQLILKEIELKTYSDFSRIEDPTLKRLKAERDNLADLIQELESGFSEYQDILPSQKDLPELSLEFSHLKRDLSIKEKIYEILIQEYELIKLSLEGQEPVFQVIEHAEVPDIKVGPNRFVICATTTTVAFIISIILVFIINAVRNIINSPERLKKVLGKK